MSWTIYKSTDASAPVLNGTTGALITLLDAILVNGYGTQPAAGWTRHYPDATPAKKVCYRSALGVASRKYIRIDDNATGTMGAKEARIMGYDTMSDLNTGTAAFGVTTTGTIISKSTSADSTARVWFAAADGRTLILFVSAAGDAYFSCTYIGEIYSYVPNDTQAFCLIGKAVETAVGGQYENFPVCTAPHVSTTRFSAVTGHHLAGTHAGVASSTTFGKVSSSLCGTISTSGNMNGQLNYPNPADGGIWLSPYSVVTDDGATCTLRGRLRGISVPLNDYVSFAHQDVFSGAGELAARAYVIMKIVSSAGSSASTQAAALALETTTPEYST